MSAVADRDLAQVIYDTFIGICRSDPAWSDADEQMMATPRDLQRARFLNCGQRALEAGQEYRRTNGQRGGGLGPLTLQESLARAICLGFFEPAAGYEMIRPVTWYQLPPGQAHVFMLLAEAVIEAAVKARRRGLAA